MIKATAYRRYLETLSSETLPDLTQFVTPDVRFVDPFNDVRGDDAMRRVFEDMFENLGDISFQVDSLCGDGAVALMAWRFSGTLRGRGFTLEGMSKIRFAEDGRVCEHVDHWDSATQFYQHLPVIGWLLSLVRRKVSTRA